MQTFEPHPYQQTAINAILEKPAVALWMEMGLGKTVVTLTAIDQLIYDRLEVSKVLVIAPKKVAEATWQDEAVKWDHLRHLRFSTVLGTTGQRTAALETGADIYIINRENVVWLVKYLNIRWPFDMVVLDEASSFKSHAAARFKALKAIRPRILRIVELTGTPQPNNLMDIWAQVYLLDQGVRLGRNITQYRQSYFNATSYGAQFVKYEEREGAAAVIQNRIRDIVLSFKASDYLTLPDKVLHDIPVVLDARAAEAYKQMQKEFLLEVDGKTVTAQQAAAVTGKLLQLCNGSVYDEEHNVHHVHDCKLEAFDELIELLAGQKCLVFYGFKFDLTQIMDLLKTRHKSLKIAVLTSAEEAAEWNAGKIDVLLAHPASCAYGLNLQQGGHHLIWYSLPWSAELYAQAEARLHRQGQTQPVIVHRLLVKGRMDEVVAKALAHKDRKQDALLEAVKTLITEAHNENKD